MYLLLPNHLTTLNTPCVLLLHPSNPVLIFFLLFLPCGVCLSQDWNHSVCHFFFSLVLCVLKFLVSLYPSFDCINLSYIKFVYKFWCKHEFSVLRGIYQRTQLVSSKCPLKWLCWCAPSLAVFIVYVFANICIVRVCVTVAHYSLNGRTQVMLKLAAFHILTCHLYI